MKRGMAVGRRVRARRAALHDREGLRGRDEVREAGGHLGQDGVRDVGEHRQHDGNPRGQVELVYATSQLMNFAADWYQIEAWGMKGEVKDLMLGKSMAHRATAKSLIEVADGMI